MHTYFLDRRAGGDGKMPKTMFRSSVLTGVVLAGGTGCSAIEKLVDALEGGPQVSYCESLCDWAVECAVEAESSISREEMEARCEEATNAADADCARAEAGDLNPDEILILNECTADVDEMTCDGLSGIEGRPPELSCIVAYGGLSDASSIDWTDPTAIADVKAYATYNAARNAVLVTGGELCDEITEELCSSLVSCSPDYDSEASDDLQELAMDSCMDALSGFNSGCKSKGLYDQDLPIDYNPARGWAQDCVDALAVSDSLCEPSSWTDIASCAGAFINPLDDVDMTAEILSAVTSYIGD